MKNSNLLSLPRKRDYFSRNDRLDAGKDFYVIAFLICFASGRVGFRGRSSPEKQCTYFALTQHPP
jgi:hypothetical protein